MREFCGNVRLRCELINPFLGTIHAEYISKDISPLMMTSSNGNFFCVTGHICGEFPGHRWIPRTKASDVELWYILWYEPWINSLINNREGGDLRRHRAHYDVIIMHHHIFLSLRTWHDTWMLYCVSDYHICGNQKPFLVENYLILIKYNKVNFLETHF